MPRFLRVSLVTLVALTMMLAVMPAPASARIFVRGWYGPAWGWGWGPAWYGPSYWGPTGYYYVPNTGTVKIDTPEKHDAVYIDGGYAGTVKEMHKFHLRPGTHDLAVQAPNGETIYNQKVEVLRGRTTEVHLGS